MTSTNSILTPLAPLRFECFEPWWLELAAYLAKLEERVRGGGDQLEASCDALNAAIKFLELHPNIGAEGQTRSLRVLLRIINDIRKGVSPDLLLARRHDPTSDPSNGRRRNGSRTAVKAVAGACVEMLMQQKFNEAEAIKIVVKKLTKHGIKYINNSHDGPESINYKQVRRWRYELRAAEDHSEAKCIFDTILQDYRPRLQQQLTLQQASALVDGCIMVLHDQGF